MIAISLKSASKQYAAAGRLVQALAASSLELSRGEMTAVAGPSGSGKTTLLLVLGGLLRPDQGALLWREQNPYELSADRRAEIRAQMTGFVFQQFHLIPYLTVLENVMIPATTTAGAATRQRATELLGRLGLSQREHHFPHQLSTGERQRVALARAFSNRPAVVLADEPTANLDADNAREVTDQLLQYAIDGGSVVVATHEPAVIERAHRVFQMRDGRLSN